MKELKEYLKREFNISDEKWEQMVNEKKEKSPIQDLNNVAMVESLQMQNINDLSGIVGMLMMQVHSLNERIIELEGK